VLGDKWPLSIPVPLSWRRARWQTKAYVQLANQARLGLVAALLLIAVTLATNQLLVRGPIDVNSAAAVMTVLVTVVGFFAVATIAVSVSLTLLSSAAANESAIMTVFVNDEERNLLLQTIFASFLVSLANLCLLAVRALHPLVALALPVLLALLTLMLMVGYILERVRLFDEVGLVEFLVRRIDGKAARLSHLNLDEGKQRVDLKADICRDLLRITAIIRRLIKNDRLRDAHTALEVGLSGFTKLIEGQTSQGFTLPAPWQMYDQGYVIDHSFARELESIEWSDVQWLQRQGGLLSRAYWDLLGSWLLTERVAFNSFTRVVLEAYGKKDLVSAETFLRWTDQVWLQRLLAGIPALHRGTPIPISTSEYATHATQETVDSERETVRSQALGVLAAILGATRALDPSDISEHWKFAGLQEQVKFLCGDLAASYLDSPNLTGELEWPGPKPDRMLLALEGPLLLYCDFMEVFVPGRPLVWELRLAQALRPDIPRFVIRRAQERGDASASDGERLNPDIEPSPRFLTLAKKLDWLAEGSSKSSGITRRSSLLAGLGGLTSGQRHELRSLAGTSFAALLDELEALTARKPTTIPTLNPLTRRAEVDRDWDDLPRRELQYVGKLVERLTLNDPAYRPPPIGPSSLHEAMAEALVKSKTGCLDVGDLREAIASDEHYEEPGSEATEIREIRQRALDLPHWFTARGSQLCLTARAPAMSPANAAADAPTSRVDPAMDER